jgi:hypothetical protein
MQGGGARRQGKERQENGSSVNSQNKDTAFCLLNSFANVKQTPLMLSTQLSAKAAILRHAFTFLPASALLGAEKGWGSEVQAPGVRT